MPLIWRGMRMDETFPEVGPGGNLLGVRVGSDEGDDIPDEEGWVLPGTGGMSVAPTLDTLPIHRIPRRLRAKYPERFPNAVGSNQLHCWSMGEGDFVEGRIADKLALRPDPAKPKRHGFVEPEEKMSIADYEAALTATQALWTRWEE